MMTVMIATTTVGMGDLYAIHISYAYARALRRNKDPVAAAAHMIEEAGAPLLGRRPPPRLGSSSSSSRRFPWSSSTA